MVIVFLVLWFIFYNLIDKQQFMADFGFFVADLINYTGYERDMLSYNMEHKFTDEISFAIAIVLTVVIYSRNFRKSDFGVE